MANLRYQTILGLVVALPGRRHTPAFVDSCPVLHIARATSPNCTHQNQNTQMTWRNGIAKNAVNLSQSRKGPRPTCRMSSKELPVWRNNTRDWSRWSDSSWASQSHSPARGYLCSGEDFSLSFPCCGTQLPLHFAGALSWDSSQSLAFRAHKSLCLLLCPCVTTVSAHVTDHKWTTTRLLHSPPAWFWTARYQNEA